MSSEIKANSIQDKTGTRVLASDSGSAWSWGSGVPANTIINIAQNQFATECEAGGSSSTINVFYSYSPAVTCTINNCQTGSKILISCFLHLSCDETNRAVKVRLIDKTNSDAVIGTEGSGGLFGFYDANTKSGGFPVSYEILYTPPSFNSGSFQVEVQGAVDDGGVKSFINQSYTGGSSREFSSNIILKEIAG